MVENQVHEIWWLNVFVCSHVRVEENSHPNLVTQHSSWFDSRARELKENFHPNLVTWLSYNSHPRLTTRMRVEQTLIQI